MKGINKRERKKGKLSFKGWVKMYLYEFQHFSGFIFLQLVVLEKEQKTSN